MSNKIKSVVKKVSKETTLPDGLYNGLWSGYVIKLKHNKETYELTTENGVRGINIPVTVSIKKGKLNLNII